MRKASTIYNEVYEERDDVDLLQICHSGDYTSTSQAAALQTLVKRGYTEAAISEWRDSRVTMGASAAVHETTDTIVRRAMRRRRLYLASGTLALLSLFAALSDSLPAAVFGLAVLAHFCVHTVLWRRPARILLLRPFNSTAQRRGLRRCLARYIRFFGHVYTLEDRAFRAGFAFLPGGGTWIWGWMGLLLSFRVKVTTESGVWKLQRKLSRRLIRNINWALSFRKIFTVTCNDQWWQRTVQVLANSSDLIIVDASEARAGLLWEIDELRFYNLAGRLILIAPSSNLDVARQLATNLSDGRQACPMFVYDVVNGRVPDPTAVVQAAATCISHNSRF